MKKIFFLYWSCLWSFAEKPFVIVIPSYNNAEWYKKNLDSVFDQDYSNYRVIYLDDNSPDNTGNLVADYITQKGMSDRSIVIKNEYRKGQLFNRYKAIHNCNDNEIIVLLDGDDWLAHKNVLSFLNNLYTSNSILMTVGNACYSSNGKKIGHRDHTQKEIETLGFRQLGFRGVHPRTFYAGVFKKIKAADLMHQGNFLMVATDIAFMMPIFEMTRSRYAYINDLLYVYNNESPLNLFKSKLAKQIYFDLLTRNKDSYQELPENWQADDQKENSYSLTHLLFVEDNYKGSRFFQDQVINGIDFDACIKVVYGQPYRSLQLSKIFKEIYQLDMGYPLDKIYQFRMNFKSNLLEVVSKCTSEYFLFSTDQLLHEENINIQECIKQLESTGALAVSFGKTNQEYLAEKCYDVLPFFSGANKIYLANAWAQPEIFKEISDNFGLLMRTQDVRDIFEKIEICHPNYYTLLAGFNSVIKQESLLLFSQNYALEKDTD